MPGLEIVIPGGINGDIATSAITVNAIRAAVRATQGLRTMLDVPVPSWTGGTVTPATPGPAT